MKSRSSDSGAMAATKDAGAAPALSGNLVGILCVMGAATAFSINDVVIKLLSDGYPLHQLTFFRSLFGMVFTLGIFVPLEGPYRNLATTRPWFHAMRGPIVICANMIFCRACHASARRGDGDLFRAPLFITALFVVLLGEVGMRRWIAVGVGLAGVVIVIAPADRHQTAALLPLVAASPMPCCRSPRKLGTVDKASTMAFYMQLSFVVFSGSMGWRSATGASATLAAKTDSCSVRLRPSWSDLALLGTLGAIISTGASRQQGLSGSEAGLIAPFEYVAMPIAIFWAWSSGATGPRAGLAGVALIAGAGLSSTEAMQGRMLRLLRRRQGSSPWQARHAGPHLRRIPYPSFISDRCGNARSAAPAIRGAADPAVSPRGVEADGRRWPPRPRGAWSAPRESSLDLVHQHAADPAPVHRRPDIELVQHDDAAALHRARERHAADRRAVIGHDELGMGLFQPRPQRLDGMPVVGDRGHAVATVDRVVGRVPCLHQQRAHGVEVAVARGAREHRLTRSRACP